MKRGESVVKCSETVVTAFESVVMCLETVVTSFESVVTYLKSVVTRLGLFGIVIKPW